MEVTGDIPQVTADSMYPSGPTELLKFPCCSRTHRLALVLTARTSAPPPPPHSPPRPELSLWPLGPAGKPQRSPRSIWSPEAKNEEKKGEAFRNQAGWIEGRTVWKRCVPWSCSPRLILEYRCQEGRQQSHRCCMALSTVQHKHSCFIAAT